MDIRPIETRYKGFRFRSRTEARWAVFFDAIGTPWEYEKEGFHLPSGPYLPDFWMPQQKCWIEIKGEEPNEKSSRLAHELCDATNHPVYVFSGRIFLPSDEEVPAAGLYLGNDGCDYPYQWCECASCGGVGIQFDGRSDRLPCKEPYCCAWARSRKLPCPTHGDGYTGGCHRVGGNFDKGYNADSPRLRKAYEAALSARFEHGESGVT